MSQQGTARSMEHSHVLALQLCYNCVSLHGPTLQVQMTKAEPHALLAFCKVLAAKLRASAEARKIVPTSPPTCLTKPKRARQPLGFVQLSPVNGNERYATGAERLRHET